MARIPRRPLAALVIAAAALSAAACAPITTQIPYAASDGVRVELGDQLTAVNLMVLTTGEGAEGVLLGGVTNHTADDTTVDFIFEGSSGALPVDVSANSTTLFGPDHESVSIASVAAPPGAILDVQISSPESGSVTVGVPVLDGTLAPYDEYLP